MKRLAALGLFLFITALFLGTSCVGDGGPEPVDHAAATRERSWDFDADDSGAIAAGLTGEVGEWKVVADSTAPSGSRVLAQVAKNSRRTFNVALARGTSYRDVDVSVQFAAMSGEIDRGGGPVWRATDARNYYIARYNPLEDNYRVYRVVEGGRTQLGSADIERTPGWHALRVTMVGDRIQCYYDGKVYLDVRDGTFKEPGQVGLWTKADAETHFDDFSVGARSAPELDAPESQQKAAAE